MMETKCPKCKSDNIITSKGKINCLDCRYQEGVFEGI